jgi:5'(3')-deoxyribonucleotidase
MRKAEAGRRGGLTRSLKQDHAGASTAPLTIYNMRWPHGHEMACKVLDGLILGVDLDGVCADVYGRMREIAAEWFERSLDDLTQNVSYNLPEWGIKSQEEYESLHRFAVTERGLFKTSPMIPGARRCLRLLSNEGARIRIITSRLQIRYFHALAVTQTTDWLDANGIPYWDLCFMKGKEQVGADIYVDDTPENLKTLRAKDLYAICFANSTNGMIGEPRAKSWEDVYRLVHERWKGRAG